MTAKKSKTQVVLFHQGVSRHYYGSDAGWSTTVHGRKDNTPQAILMGETMTLACEVSEDSFAFRMFPEAERRQYFWRQLRHRLIMLGVGLGIVVLGAFTVQSVVPTPLKVLGVVLLVVGDATVLGMVVSLAFRSRAPRYDFEVQPSTSFRAGIQHGVVLI